MIDRIRRFLQWLLFVNELTPTTPIPRTTESVHVLSILVKKNQRISARNFHEFLAQEFMPKLWRQHEAWGATSMEILHDASWGGVLCLPMQLTRCYSFARMLCWIYNIIPPPPYTTRFGRLYDAVIEISFARFPETFEQLSALLRGAREIGQHSAIASQRQATVYQGPSTGSVANRIRLCFLVRRPKNTTREACQAYWSTHHADLVLRNMDYLELTRYRQIFAIAKDKDWYDDTFDGMACAEKPALLIAIWQMLKFNSLRFNNTLVLDELNFTVNTPALLLKSSAQWPGASTSSPS